ncbi:MAG: type II secretion system protein N [Nevskiaceae bacterium]|jgi:hypothetical protein|nr:type II secretion system protein N [Nevskiaceae bacterium]
MKRWLLLGLAAFFTMLLIRLPAAWFARALPSQLQCDALAGSVWRGQCMGLSIAQGVAERPPLRMDALNWSLHPLALLRGQISADVDLVRGQDQAHALVIHAGGAQIDVQHLNGSLRIDRQLLPPLPAGWKGVAVFDDVGLKLDGSMILELSGVGQLSNLTDAAGESLGSYQLDFGSQPQTAPFSGQFQSLEGPLQLQGRITLQANTGWLLEGTVAAQSTTPAELARMLELLGPADASGKRPFSMEGEP